MESMIDQRLNRQLFKNIFIGPQLRHGEEYGLETIQEVDYWK
jgi:hypothetical protein